MSFAFVPFGSLYVEPVRNGLTRPTAVRGDGYRMVNMGELFAYDQIAEQEMERVQLNDRELQVATLEVGDLLFARSSLKVEGTGKCSIVYSLSEVTTFESHLIRARLDRSKADPRFYFYFFQSYYGRATVLSIAKQVGAAGLPGSKLAGLSVPQPAPTIQYRIADILSAYDDLIENNRRRMALLEDAARQLYREWFVRLRFPGHEHTRIINDVPEGWEQRRIGDVADCVGGGTPSTSVSSYWEDGDVTWVTPTDVTRNRHFILLDSEKKITDAGLQNSSAKLVPPHAVLMTSRASVGFFALAGKEVCTNQGFISIVVKDAILSPYFLFHLSERVEEIRAMGSGSTYPEVSRGKFKELEVLLPKHSLTIAFCEYVSELLIQIRVLKQQNQKLRTARDLLLPRLMSGEIAV